MNAHGLPSAQTTYLLCLKRYLFNSGPALRMGEICPMITVHLDKLSWENPFVKIQIHLAAGEGILHLFSHPPIDHGLLFRMCSSTTGPMMPYRLHSV